MSSVGIIANPAAGKDVRRVVSYTNFTSNVIKSNQIRAIISGIDSTGVEEILIMPDYDFLGQRALMGISGTEIKAKVSMLDMPLEFNGKDSTLAAKLMEKAGVGCIVTLGGDGTNRDVAKGTRNVPIVPVSSGTNNVFPVLIDPASAGIAAGIIALNFLKDGKTIRNHKRLVIIKNGQEVDMALVDAVVLDRQFVGSRAFWDLAEVKQAVCTRAEPHNLGMTRVGGNLHPIGTDEERGIYVKLGEGNVKVKASVLPGLISEVSLAELKILKIGESVKVEHKPSVIALDGERELLVKSSDDALIRLQKDGPPVVNIAETLREAVKKGFFKN